MNVWVIRDLEPLPIDGEQRRLMRAGMLSRVLARDGHKTRWITSSFDHYRKLNRLDAVGETAIEPNLDLVVLRGRGYDRNISLARIRHNRAFASDLVAYARAVGEKPDIIVTDIPTTETACAAIKLARQWSIPSVLSIRDLWPDFFADYLPPQLRPIARPGLAVLRQQASYACRNATAIVGISTSYLDWGVALAKRKQSVNDRVFPLGYTPKRLSPEDISRRLSAMGLPDSRPIVSLVGSWGATYDLGPLPDLAIQLPHLHFVIAGELTGQPELKSKLESLPNVTAIGWLDADDIAALLTSSRLGLLPYGTNAPQGLPNKVFEYMAYGVYQIATLAGDIEEFYAENRCGVTVADMRAQRLVALIDALTGDPRIEAERQARIDRFEAHYSADVIYRHMASHIVRLTES